MPKIEIQLAEVPSESLYRLETCQGDVVVDRQNDSFAVFEDRCPHAHWPLSEGDLRDGVLSCVGHGWEFDVTSGRCLTVPGCALKLLPVTIENGEIKIEVDS
jgi:nitrite reductase/ring-hydroxylating ferredoxin subunit